MGQCWEMMMHAVCFHSINCPYKEGLRLNLHSTHVVLDWVSIQLIAPTKRDSMIRKTILSSRTIRAVSIQLIAPTKRDFQSSPSTAEVAWRVSIQLIAPTKRDLTTKVAKGAKRMCFHSINCPYKEGHGGRTKRVAFTGDLGFPFN